MPSYEVWREINQYPLPEVALLKEAIGDALLRGRMRGVVMDALRRENLCLLQRSDHVFAFTPGDMIGECLVRDGEYQRDLTCKTMEIVKPKSVLEIGANIGTQTVYFFDYGAERVTAIEPAPVNLAQLELNLRLNGIQDKVTIIPVAASCRPGTANFAQYRYNQGRSAIVNASVGDGQHDVISVPTVRAEDVVGFTPDLIWIDVEEHEIEVMRGLGKLLGVPMLVEFGRHAMDDDDFGWFVETVLPQYSRMRAYETGFADIASREIDNRQYNLLLT